MAMYQPNRGSVSEIHAVIGVWRRGDLTYYVKRSKEMENYKGVWSLLSIQFEPSELRDRSDLHKVQELMEQMSDERLGGTPISVMNYLDSGNSSHNRYEKHVYLHLYEVRLQREPTLNPDYYTLGAWLTAQQYEERNAGQPCGLCMRLWSDYAWLTGIADRPFVPRGEANS